MKDKLVNGFCLGVNVLATASQADAVLRYIQLGLSILSTLVILTYNIYRWWIKSKQDGKITPDEIKEGFDIIQNGVEDIKNQTKGEKDNGNKN